jgi:hypothetical protein
MADLTVAEDRAACLPSEAQVNLWALTQRYFEERKYTLLKQEEEYALYACLHGDASAGYYICDIFIVSPLATLVEAEAATARLDGMAEKVRRALFRGKPIHTELRVQEHGFLKLHRPYVCFSYTYREKPVGFQIRPLILISEGTNIWEYFPGPTTRVDAISFPTALNGYLKAHWDTLKTSHQHLLNLQKFRYPKLARWLIGYGPIPIIAFLFFNLFWAIAQQTLPISLVGVVGLSIALYGGCIGAAYLLHGLFERAQLAELQELTPFQQTRASPAYNAADSTSQVTPLPAEQQKVEIIEADEPPPMVAPPQANTGFSRAQVQMLIRKILITTELGELTASVTRLLAQVFQRVLETDHLESPPSATLPELLKVLRPNPIVGKYYRDFRFWISKLETQTPFDPNELREVKKFLLKFLFQLQLLPEDLQKLVQTKVPRQTPIQVTFRGDPLNVPLPDRPLPPASLQAEPPKPAPLADPLPPPPYKDMPDLEVDSQVFTEIPQVNGYQVRKICERRENGIYCTLYVDKRKAQFADLLQQFAASTRDFDINRNYVDINNPEDTLTARELSGVRYPVVVVGCGDYRQILTYGQQQDDALRLHSLIASFLHGESPQGNTPHLIDPDSESSLEDAEEERGPPPPTPPKEAPTPLRKKPQQGEELISLRERTPKNGDANQAAFATASREPSRMGSGDFPKVASKELPKPPPKVEFAETPKAEYVELPQESSKVPIPPPSDAPSQRIPENAPKADVIELPKAEPKPTPSRPLLTVTPKPEPPRPAATPMTPIAPSPSNYKRIDPLMIKNLGRHQILVDGTNLAFLLSDALKDGSGPRLDCVFQVVEMITRSGFAKENIMVFFDASIEKKFEKVEREEDYTRLTAYMQQGTHPKFRIVASGSQADTALLALGNNTDGAFIILTNDGMDDQPDWAFRHRVPVTLDQNDAPQLLIGSATALMNQFRGKGNVRPKKEGQR